jgi:hypothetical protein
MKLYAVINSEGKIAKSTLGPLLYTFEANALFTAKDINDGLSVIPIEATFTRIVEQKVELEVEG